ncbi:MAG: hypothetical protein V1705_01945 [bacterium]
MQVFEYHFNPQKQNKQGRTQQTPDIVFDSFCYEPSNIYEEKAGSLYMAGLLKSALPQNINFLDNLARVIKDRHYKLGQNDPGKTLKEDLKTANEFLDGLSKKGDVSWLGHLSFAAISLKKFDLNFTKIGAIKIFLLRSGEIIDIDKRLKFQDIEPYPLKVFGNIVSGKLAENDILLILTKEINDFFQTEGLLAEIAGINPFSANKLKSLLLSKNAELSKITGLCLVLFLSDAVLTGKKETFAANILPKELKEFSFKKALDSFLHNFRIPRFSFPFKGSYWRNKKIILVLFLAVLLALGFFLSEHEKKQQFALYQMKFEEIEKEASRAIKDENASLLISSWDEISSLIKTSRAVSNDLKKKTNDLQNEISENLFSLNKLTEISDPQQIFAANPEDFIPQKIIADKNNIYLFSPYAPNLLKINSAGESQILTLGGKFSSAAKLRDSLLFFAKPNHLTIITGDDFLETDLILPSSDFSFDQITSFESNLYVLDKSRGEILKYPSLDEFKWGLPQIWLKAKTEKPKSSKSLAIDGNVWILNNNELLRYYFGENQENISLSIFPPPKNFSKVLSPITLPYFYLLEPEQSRVVVLSKDGGVVKQFQSKKFDLLLDFYVSDDGKIIYLLNGQKIYQIKN